ncbi:MAG TPA: metallophosphoesterase [Kofleriaceae bacterium]|nr:metallophosphoesterase [Kofleriaceae bacterium]
MKLIVHISDPHFGEADAAVAEALLDEINALEPTLVAISGDLTQRARRAQFAAARAWLDRLFVPYLVVPGNHDIPFYDVVRRFTSPRERYLHYISSDLAPSFVDDEVAVCGIDTTKSFTLKSGHITREHAERVAALLAPHTNHWRVLVAHHPFEHASGAADAMPLLEAAGVDLVLTGHLHLPHLEDIAMRTADHRMVAVHAGTCMSTRLRGEPNGYNQLYLSGEHVRIVHREWRNRRFVDGAEKEYRRSERGRERIVKEREVPANVLRFPRSVPLV